MPLDLDDTEMKSHLNTSDHLVSAQLQVSCNDRPIAAFPPTSFSVQTGSTVSLSFRVISVNLIHIVGIFLSLLFMIIAI